jgi:SAM-dependent methyltransferase
MNPGEYVNLDAAEERMWWFRGMKRILLRLLDSLARGGAARDVLEVGCGTGAIARLLQSRYGWRVTPADLSEEGLRHARRDGCERLVRCDALLLPFPDESFDLLLTLDMMVHLEPGQEQAALREFARVLKPGGALVLRAAAFQALWSRHSTYVGERQRYTRSRLRRLAEANGLTIRRATYANCFLLPVAWLKFRVWEPLVNAPVASGVGLGPWWLEASLYAPLALEAQLIGTGLDLPLGQSVVLVAEKP